MRAREPKPRVGNLRFNMGVAFRRTSRMDERAPTAGRRALADEARHWLAQRAEQWES
jgi:hypothetical protein